MTTEPTITTLKLRPLVRWWAQQMERVLRENNDKRGWQSMPNWEIYRRMTEEFSEITQAMAGYHGNLIDELVDLANFAAFMAWNNRQGDGHAS